MLCKTCTEEIAADERKEYKVHLYVYVCTRYCVLLACIYLKLCYKYKLFTVYNSATQYEKIIIVNLYIYISVYTALSDTRCLITLLNRLC